MLYAVKISSLHFSQNLLLHTHTKETTTLLTQYYTCPILKTLFTKITAMYTESHKK